MKAIVLVVVIIGVVAQPSAVLSQQPNPLSFFPHHLGDVWEYTGVLPPYHVWQERILADSLGADGRYYVNRSYYGPLRIDTNSYEVRGNFGGSTDYPVLVFKLDARLSETWVRRRGPQFVYMARVAGIYDGFILGMTTQVKQIELTDSASGLLFLTEYLASGLGVIGRDIDAFPEGRLSGAIINGIHYGTITLHVQEQNPHSVESFVLFQNYPNPFNPTTLIPYQMQRGGNAELRVSDILGRDVAILFNGYQHAGVHHVQFDGTGLPSGAYIYTLKTETGTKSRRMLLIR